MDVCSEQQYYISKITNKFKYKGASMKTFNEMFRQKLERSFLSQADIAVKTGLSQASICRYLNNERTPTEKNQRKLIEALGYDENNFYTDEIVRIDKETRIKHIRFPELYSIIKYRRNHMSDEERRSLIDLLV